MPINDLVAGQNTIGAPLVRTEPIQERSAARIDALLDAAAEVVDEIGFDRLTTAMVAERAGASIGTVYRYFPDRIVLLQGLRDRAVLRYRHSVVAAIHAQSPAHWWNAVECAIDAFVGMFRTEPGFRIIRFTDRAIRTRLSYLRGASVQLEVDAPEPFELDGDAFGDIVGLDLSVDERALRVKAPA